MKYYLIKANDMKKTEFVGEYYFDLQKEPVELTKEDIARISYNLTVMWDTTENGKLNWKLCEKIRKVLE